MIHKFYVISQSEPRLKMGPTVSTVSLSENVSMSFQHRIHTMVRSKSSGGSGKAAGNMEERLVISACVKGQGKRRGWQKVTGRRKEKKTEFLVSFQSV